MTGAFSNWIPDAVDAEFNVMTLARITAGINKVVDAGRVSI